MRRIPVVKIPKDLQQLFAITDPDFWTWLMTWWREARSVHQRHRPRVNVDFIAHPTRILPVYHPPKPEDRTFDGGGGG